MVDGYEVFRIHQHLGAAPAEERAERISARLEELATASDFNPKDIKAAEEDGVDDGPLRRRVDRDPQRRRGPRIRACRARRSRFSTSNCFRKSLTLAREQHTPHYLWRAAIYAAVTMLIYLLVLWLIMAGTRWILRTVETSAKVRFKSIKIQQSEIVHGARLTALLASAVRLLRAVVIAIVTYVALAKAFSFFPWTREHGQRLLGYVVRSADHDGAGDTGISAEPVLHLRDRGGDPLRLALPSRHRERSGTRAYPNSRLLSRVGAADLQDRSHSCCMLCRRDHLPVFAG